MKKFFTFLCFMVFTIAAFAQSNITGKLMDAETDEPLIGASVQIEGTSNGTVSDFDGNFVIPNVSAGTYTLVVSYIGYEDVKSEITVASGDLDVGTISLGSDVIGLSEVKVVASYAEIRKTPVAVSNITAEEIELKVGNQEFPEILKSTPSIYATKSGGGFGDSRINVRGFNQRNVAVMINGIPVNDMENGWVYWSNWAGLADVTKTTQIQRGLGASKLAINSVGGTINIITKTTDQKQGGTAFTNVGNDGYLKYGATISTGRTENGWAFTVSGSRTTGDGYIDATWVNAWSYFTSIAKEIGDNHQLVFTAIGAPQRHGQRSFREDLSQYVGNDEIDRLFSEGDDLIDAGMVAEGEALKQQGDDMFKQLIEDSDAGDWDDQYVARSIRYNGDWGYKDGQIFNNRENFYHKPQMALNHYWNINSNSFLATSAYYSTGRGGGTGDRGRIGGRGPWGWRDSETDQMRYDDIVAWNSGRAVDGFPSPNTSGDLGYIGGERNGIIRRASMNEHNWLGVLSTFTHDLSDNLKLLAGVDLRHYRGIHYRRVVDLLGLNGWVEQYNVNNSVNPEQRWVDTDGDTEVDWWETGVVKQSDNGNFTIGNEANKIQYDNDGIVGWQGFFGQLEYSQDKLNVFAAGSVSNTSYQREDRFNYFVDQPNNTDTESAAFNPVVTKKYNFLGYNAKVGANVNLTEQFNVFVNGGYYSRAPIFDAIFYNFNNVDINEDAVNEAVIAGEAGLGFNNDKFNVNVNAYYTNWLDRNFAATTTDPATGLDIRSNIKGMDALHTGVEVELDFRPVKGLRFKGMASVGSWEWASDVEADIFNDDQVLIGQEVVYADGVKVGDAAQTTFYLSAAYEFDFGLGIDIEGFAFDNLYADFEPLDFTDANASVEEKQSLKLPSYELVNAGLTYKFKIYNSDARFRINVNNLMDKLYIAETNDSDYLYESGGFFGFGRTWNCGLKLTF